MAAFGVAHLNEIEDLTALRERPEWAQIVGS
jgi:hypothetical protein